MREHVSTLTAAWRPRALREVYATGVSGDEHGMEGVFRVRHMTLRSAINASAGGAVGVGRVLRRLTDRGLAVTELGLDFSRVWAAHGDAADVVTDLVSLYRLMMFTAMPPMHWIVPHVLWHTDQRAIRVASRGGGYRTDMLSALIADGHAVVANWQIDISALREQAFALLEKQGGGRRRVVQKATPSSWRELSALMPLLANNSALSTAARAYLGTPVRFDGAQILRLTNSLRSASQYVVRVARLDPSTTGVHRPVSRSDVHRPVLRSMCPPLAEWEL